ADHTARVEIGGRKSPFTLESGTCGLDGDTVFVLGHSEGGEVLQAVVAIDPESREGIPDLTGVTVSDGPDDIEAFGSGAWDLRGGAGGPPGSIERSSMRGSRIELEGTAVDPTSSGDAPSTGEEKGGEAGLAGGARCAEPD